MFAPHALAMLFSILLASADEMVIHSFGNGLAGVRAANPDVHLSVRRDPSGPDEQVLQVEYPAPTANPAGRDVQCEAENRNWSSGRAVSFQVKPAKALRLSVSFFDRNRVVYTSWADLKEGVWQTVRFTFADMKPNPYFQPPDAKQGSAIDVSDVPFIAFAPQDQTSGRVAIARFVVEK